LATDTKLYWDAIAHIWQDQHPQSLWRIHSDEINTALLDRWLPAGRFARVLKTDAFDEAVSAGLYPVLAQHARAVMGMDVSTTMLHAARARHPALRAAGADTRHLPYADGAFDAVISNSTLDHLNSQAEIAASLRELHRVLRHQGHLILTLDNPDNPAIALRNALPLRWLNRLGLVPYQIGSTCSERTLRRMLSQTGFRVLDVRFVMHHPSILAVLLTRGLEQRASPATQMRFLRGLMALERLADWPTRARTGHFVAVRAIKADA
jgi:SAM-dependent methyltransferase